MVAISEFPALDRNGPLAGAGGGAFENVEDYEDMRVAAERAVLRHTNPAGELELVSEATPVGEKQMYATRPFGVFPWGQGPLVLLLCRLAKRK